VWVLETLEHLEFIKDHALIALDVLLQNDFDCDLAVGAIRFTDNAVGTRAQGSTKPILCLSLVALRLALKAIEHGVD
jgi:hypothetical protein